MLAKIFGLAGGAIAQVIGAVVVPPRPLIVGSAIEDFEMDRRMFKPDPAELNEILRLQPDRQPAVVERRLAEIADADASHLDAVLVGVERAGGFSECLADAITAVGTRGDVSADPVIARIKADGMVRRGEHHALDALPARRLEQVVTADDVGLQDLIPGAFDRIAAEMQDAVDAIADRL